MKIEVCHGQNCYPYGGKALAEALDEHNQAYQVIPCRSLCQYAPVAYIEGKAVLKANLDDLKGCK